MVLILLAHTLPFHELFRKACIYIYIYTCSSERSKTCSRKHRAGQPLDQDHRLTPGCLKTRFFFQKHGFLAVIVVRNRLAIAPISFDRHIVPALFSVVLLLLVVFL